jgi:beta-glucosidase
LYVHKEKSAIERAEKELKGFQKVFLQPNESKKVTITLNKDAFEYYNETKNAWDTEAGAYKIQIGSSSRKILLSGLMNL